MVCLRLLWITSRWYYIELLLFEITLNYYMHIHLVRAHDEWAWWVMAHICMSHGIHMNESRHTYVWVEAHICMSHGTHIYELWHTCVWVTAHIGMSDSTHTSSESTLDPIRTPRNTSCQSQIGAGSQWIWMRARCKHQGRTTAATVATALQLQVTSCNRT